MKWYVVFLMAGALCLTVAAPPVLSGQPASSDLFKSMDKNSDGIVILQEYLVTCKQGKKNVRKSLTGLTVTKTATSHCRSMKARLSRNDLSLFFVRYCLSGNSRNSGWTLFRGRLNFPAPVSPSITTPKKIRQCQSVFLTATEVIIISTYIHI